LRLWINSNKAGLAIHYFKCRMINPGHGIEAMWFIMDQAERNNDSVLAEKDIERRSLDLLNFVGI